MRGEVSQITIDNRLCHLPHLCEGYAPEIVFNADKTGLLYREIPSNSMIIKSQDAPGIKKKLLRRESLSWYVLVPVMKN